MAGGVSGSGNSSYYLYTNQSYWVGSPYVFDRGYSIEFRVDNIGVLYDAGVNSIFWVRPVISLSSEAKLTGDGTYNDVYTVS